MSTPARPSVKQLLSRPVLFVSGKGGVGKTSVSQAIARAQARSGKRTLWIGFEDPTRPAGELRRINKNLFELNCAAELAIEEYVGMKLHLPGITSLFVRNPLVKFLAKAGPGVHELVLLGKLWFERKNYDAIVADMPSTGFGLAMFQSIENWSKLFKSGPLQKDAQDMLRTFSNSAETGHLIVALPEEMPLRESLELESLLLRLFPTVPPGFLINRLFPDLQSEAKSRQIESDPDEWKSPLASSIQDFALRRSLLEQHHLQQWRNAGIVGESLDWQPVRAGGELSEFSQVVLAMEKQIAEKEWL